MMKNFALPLATAGLACFFFGCAPQTAEEIVARSVEAHGGDALTQWSSMVAKGKVHQKDGRLWFNGELIVYAQKPDKIRIERDLTKFERGRFFTSEIYNGGKGWILRNLIPYYRDELATQYKAKLDRCEGIAFHANHSDSMTLIGEEEVEGQPAYVIEAVAGDAKATLYIDTESYYLVKEAYDNVTLHYSEFKELGGAIRAGKVLEVTEGRRTVEVTYTYDTIETDVEIDPMLFEEDIPSGT
jgi:outer membrane lipoprotein-sorting protein